MLRAIDDVESLQKRRLTPGHVGADWVKLGFGLRHGIGLWLGVHPFIVGHLNFLTPCADEIAPRSQNLPKT